MFFRGMAKYSLVTGSLILGMSSLAYASGLNINIENDYVSMNEYVYLVEGEQEIKEILFSEEKTEKKYILRLKDSNEEINILEVFEDGQGVYINGKYIPFEEAKINGFTVPKAKKIKMEEGILKLPVSFFEKYLGGEIEEDKLVINKELYLNIGVVGEFNEIDSIGGEELELGIEAQLEEVEEPELEEEDIEPEIEQENRPEPEIIPPVRPEPEIRPPVVEPDIEEPEVEVPDIEVPEVEEPEIEEPDIEIPEEPEIIPPTEELPYE